MTKKETKALNKVDELLRDAGDVLLDGLDQAYFGVEEGQEDETKPPKKAIKKALKTIEKAAEKLYNLLDG
jgi:hypothetical protein